MSRTYTVLDDRLHAYLVDHSQSDPVLDELAAESDRLGDLAGMRMSPDQAALMTVVVRAAAARRALEIGTFTGYGSIAIARGLPSDGTLITCEISSDQSGIAHRAWTAAGLDGRIEQRIGPALDTLADIDSDPPFDFVFIDADKANYPGYYEQAMRLLRSGGTVAIDNVFRNGDVAEPVSDAGGRGDDRGLAAIMELNDTVASDPRLSSRAMVSVADGLTLAVKA